MLNSTFEYVTLQDGRKVKYAVIYDEHYDMFGDKISKLFKIKIFQSHKFVKYRDMKEIIKHIYGRLVLLGYTKSRIIMEWETHNLLWKLGIKRLHTSDVDFVAGDNIFIRIGYYILGSIAMVIFR